VLVLVEQRDTGSFLVSGGWDGWVGWVEDSMLGSDLSGVLLLPARGKPVHTVGPRRDVLRDVQNTIHLLRIMQDEYLASHALLIMPTSIV